MFDLNSPLDKIILNYENGKCLQLSGKAAIEFQKKMREVYTVYLTEMINKEIDYNLEMLEWEMIRKPHKEIDYV